MVSPGAKPKALDGEALYQKGVAALARRSRSTAELERLLRSRASTEAALRAALARLREHGYLDDGRFAESFARFQKESQGYGAARAARQLRQRGVSAELAAAAVARAYAGTSEAELLADYLRRKRIARPENWRQAAGLYRRLRQAGYGGDAIQAALRSWRLDAAWLERLTALELEATTDDGE